MSDSGRTRLDRLRDWWWIIGALGFVAGLGSAGFVKFTTYYLAEQSSIATLQALIASSTLSSSHLATVDATLRDQQYTNQSVAAVLKDLADHVHALDARADADRTKITDSLAVQEKNSQAILLLLEPKAPRK